MVGSKTSWGRLLDVFDEHNIRREAGTVSETRRQNEPDLPRKADRFLLARGAYYYFDDQGHLLAIRPRGGNLQIGPVDEAKTAAVLMDMPAIAEWRLSWPYTPECDFGRPSFLD